MLIPNLLLSAALVGSSSGIFLPSLNKSDNLNTTSLNRPFHRVGTPFPRVINVSERIYPASENSSSLPVELTKVLAARDPQANRVGTCAPDRPCTNGACCNRDGRCGFSPDYCGSSVCINNCGAKAECGIYAAKGRDRCPLSLCCSDYGFCGSTPDHCIGNAKHPCQPAYGTCGFPPSKPSCNDRPSSELISVGYYAIWAADRECDKRPFNELPLDELTHVNFAFAFFHPTTFEISPMPSYPSSYFSDFTEMKARKPSLKAWVSIGGWTFNNRGNDPDTRTAFSDMCASEEKRAAFIDSLRRFMEENGFDGVDLDWEYPGMAERGGRIEDTANLAILVREMRASFGNRFGISLALPPSRVSMLYFDLKAMEEHVDWFNVMTYNLRSPLDRPEADGGSYVRPHANLTEIDDRLKLLWRADIDPKKVVLGVGWHGRTYQLRDPTCRDPGCPSVPGVVGMEGECTHTPGAISRAEINRLIGEHSLKPGFDADAAVNWLSWGENHWVSYDGDEALELKKQFASRTCLRGTMIWSVDQA